MSVRTTFLERFACRSILVLALPLLLATAGRSEQGPVVIRAERAGASPEVWTLLPTLKSFDPNQVFELPNDFELEDGKPRIDLTATASPDGALQIGDTILTAPDPSVAFEGVNQFDQASVSGFQVSPPDTVGDVGPNHYVQCVNLACRIFSKAGVPAGGAFTPNTLFSSIGGDCFTTNDGDPIVLYDPLADRWLISQFAVANRPPSHECVAISQTGDPTGSYWVYDFVIPQNYFNDYPKLGVWSDGYYMTAPLFEGPVFGQGAFVMNRAKMLAGDPTAEMIFFDLTTTFPGLSRILPADVDGPAPPPGTPNYLAGITAVEFGDEIDGVRLFEISTDWNDPQSSTIEEIPYPGGALAVAAFDPTFTEVSGNCGVSFTSRDDIEQPAPATCGARVDSLSNRPMHRLAYRNFGTHESLVFTHTVDVNATPPTATSGHLAGIRYYELRRTLPAGAFAVQEQATFSPDSDHRFMGSAAMDAVGDLAVGYSVSSTTVFPSIRYAARLAGDPPGGLFQGENDNTPGFAIGNDPQRSTGSRWGDYSALSVDPADDCTFWYTQEYYQTPNPPGCSTTACWKTRIGSFALPGCSSPTQTGTLNGTVTSLATALPIAGVLVQTSNGYAAETDGAGFYTMDVPADSYDVTALKAGYGVEMVSAVAVVASSTTTLDLQLGSGSLAGTVTNAVGGAPIVGAVVAISNGQLRATDGGGNYSVPLSPGTYGLTASAAGFYQGALAGLVVASAGVTPASVALQPSPQLSVAAAIVDDWHGGNGSGFVDSEECFRLFLTLDNTAAVGATGVSAVLSTTTAGVAVDVDTAAFDDIPAAGTSEAQTAFELTTDSSFAGGTPIEIVLTVTTAGGTLQVPFTLSTAGGPAAVFAASGPIVIPDNSGVGASLFVPVSGFSGTLSKVVVKLRATHTYDGDLVLRVISPDGTVGLLTSQVGGAGANFGTGSCPTPTFTTFDDDAATWIVNGSAPFAGTYRPMQPLTGFAGKASGDVNGSWQVKAVDLGPADVGTIDCAEIWLNGSFAGGACSGIFRDDFESGGPDPLRWSSLVSP